MNKHLTGEHNYVGVGRGEKGISGEKKQQCQARNTKEIKHSRVFIVAEM